MMQLNLLPDVKLEYIRAQRSRRLVLTVAIIAGSVSLGILLILLSVYGIQKKHLSDLNRDISSETSQLQHKKDINKILTVQNQLESLTALHAGKPAASRLFDYLNEVTPANVDITDFTIDFTKQTATIAGSADALSSVNKYVDTLKFTKYTSDTSTAANHAFSSIVLSNFGLGNTTSNGGKPASYTITLTYDKNIFDITQKVDLSVPSITTTRSGIDQPAALFKAAPTTTPAGGSH